MRKYFGTDGVRGVANKELTPELAFKLGRYGGYVLTKETKKPKIVIGRDTRISGQMLEGALVAGLLSIGAEVMKLGVISTPGVAFLTKALSANAGIMISASHNPVQDNGIKFFGSNGFKLLDDQEEEIEELLRKAEGKSEADDFPRPIGENIGTVNNYYEGGQKYLAHLKQTIQGDLSGLNVAIDCAHGSASPLAAQLFADLDVDEIYTIGASPNGKNINDNVGSTHPESLVELVKEKGADIGLAFDGDADRLIAVDEKGNIIDGDQIIYICATHLKEQGQLSHNTVVSTVMSNLGFYKALEEKEINTRQTDVGDRYVMEEMRKGDYDLGGEQSGHIIFLDYATTGDGLLSAIQLCHILKESNKPLSELASEMPKYPQRLVNVEVEDKHAVLNNEAVKQVIEAVEKDMSGDGRVLVRPSGTESLVRVMVEAPTEELCDQYNERIVELVKKELGS